VSVFVDLSLPAPLAAAVNESHARMQGELLADQARSPPWSPLSLWPSVSSDTGRPIVTETAPSEASTAPIIEVKLAGAAVRVACGTDGALLTAVLRAVRASASRA
jgi:hypothetical protein